MDKLEKRLHVKSLGYSHWFMYNIISKLKDHSISVDHARYVTSILAKYLDTTTTKETSMSHKTTLTHDMIFSKEYASTSDKQAEVLYRE